MSTQQPENQGGAQPPAPEQQAAVEPEGQGAAQAGNDPAVAVSSGVVPGDGGQPAAVTEGTVQPAVEHLDRPPLDACPSCKIGLLYPITYDEKAAHEVSQPLFAPRQRSGGSMFRKCFHCDYGDSVALSPSDAPPDPRTW